MAGAYKGGRPTMGGRVHILEEHFHSAKLVYPTGAAGVTLTCGDAAAWTLGSFTEIVPANTIAKPFDIHFVEIEAVSTAATYEVVLYAVETEIGRFRFTAAGTPNNIVFVPRPFQCGQQPKNTQIQAKIMSSSGNANTSTISVEYHTY